MRLRLAFRSIEVGIRKQIVAVGLILLSACTFNYKPDLEQGFVISEKRVAKLEVGMDEQAVLSVMGLPSLINPFIEDRWDYYYAKRVGGSDHVDQQTLTLIFKQGKLSEIGEIHQSSALVEEVQNPVE